MFYKPDENRYKEMSYRRCGKTGLKLPAVSLGLWHNFGSVDVYDNAVRWCRRRSISESRILTLRTTTGRNPVRPN